MTPLPWFYAVNDRPVKVVANADGGGDLLALDWTTGGFVPAPEYWEALSDPWKDVDQFTAQQFDLRVAAHRIGIVQRLCARALVWEATGDGIFPFASTIEGRALKIRINDFPAEPLYTLMAGDDDIVDLDDWPAAWVKPETAY